MNLAEEMYEKYAPNGKCNLERNRKEALVDIRNAMIRGEESCDLYLDWTDLPDDWVVFPETIDYLRENGFNVEDKILKGGIFPDKRYVTITWKH